jgi:hypothetical protein
MDGARVGPPGTGGDQQPSSSGGGQRDLVAGVHREVEADDRPVEVEGQETVATAEGATAAD